MKPASCAVLFCVCLMLSSQARCTTLPDTCGDAKTVIDVTTHKGQPPQGSPDPGKAHVVFIETADKNTLPVTARIALDGSWVGANRGNSYFEVAVLPGEHHVCADWQLEHRYIKDSPAFDIFTAEAGKTYYFLVHVVWTANVEPVQVTRYDGDMTLQLSRINGDEGKYLVLNSKFSTSSQKK